MKNKAYNISHYTFNENETLLIDANIWLYLFPAPSDSQNRFIQQYSLAFKHIRASKKVTIAISSLVLSEYLNRYCRIEYDARCKIDLAYKMNYPSFKKFRQSTDYLLIGQQAASFAKAILKLCNKIDDDFSISNTTQILKDFESGNTDFNDALIADCCSRHGWKLVTHDGDFIDGGIEVLTTNPKLLRNCPI